MPAFGRIKEKVDCDEPNRPISINSKFTMFLCEQTDVTS